MFTVLKRVMPLRQSFFYIPRFAARICSIWPETEHTVWRTCHFVAGLTAVSIGAFGELFYGIIHLNDLDAALEAFCPGLTKAICMLKMTLFFLYRCEWQQMLQHMRSILMHGWSTSKQHVKIVQYYSFKAAIYCFILIAFGNTTNAIFNIRPFAINIYRYIRAEPLINELPFRIYLPDIFVKYPLYPLTYGILFVSGLMTCMTFSAVDGFFVCSCMYFSSMFRMLQHDIQHIFHVNLKSPDFSTVAENLLIRHQLCAVVAQHNVIIDLCAEFTRKFAFIILMHFLFAAITLCSSILNLMLNLSNINLGLLLYVCYSLAALTQVFLYCIGGSYVQQTSAALAQTLCEIEWYKCDVQTRKMILMMLQRSQRAQTIAVPFFTLTLPAFTSIISTTGSYITLLNTFL